MTAAQPQGIDVPIVKLVPRNDRKVSETHMKRIESSLRAVGLIDPFVVFPDGDNYEILDGTLRYRILLDMGVETVPCLIAENREGFTSNRMVNRLSRSQEMRMLKKSLEELDEGTVASALGMKKISRRLNQDLHKKLHPSVIKAFESGKVSLQCARELTHVKPERQAEILKLMDSCDDYGVVFAKGLVLKTPPAKRIKKSGARNPWSRNEDQKSDLLKKLKQAEQQQDFYSGLYRQYTTNLLKLVIYARTLLANERVREHLEANHPQRVELFEQIVDSTEQ